MLLDNRGKYTRTVEYREKMSKIQKGKGSKEERSRTTKRLWQDEEYREKMLKIMQSSEYREKMSQSKKGFKHSEMTKKKMSKRKQNMSDETKLKISKTNKRKGIKPPSRKGEKLSKEHRRKLSASQRGISRDEWDGYVSFEPYSHLFNEELKEVIRNRDRRYCQLCGKLEILNAKRLTVHHIDGDKMNSDEGNLIALCNACNSKKDTIEKEFLLASKMKK